MSFLDRLPDRYRVILCDIWGCVHDGVDLYPGADERLGQWKGEGRTVILITNAPRTADAVRAQLGRIGLPGSTFDGIATSGEAGIAALMSLERPVGFIGTRQDRDILAAKGVEFTQEGFDAVAVTGLDEQRRSPSAYVGELEQLAERGVVMHCLNPDLLVIRGGVPEACAGAIADRYEAIGGAVEWYGKPHATIYRHALHLAGDPEAKEVLAIGDGLQTDILGAARMGFDCVFVTGGIHAGEPFPHDFAPSHGLGDWKPVAVVPSLG